MLALFGESEQNGTPKLPPRTLRLGIILGLLIYSVFGIVDYYSLPVSHRYTWLIRYAIITPSTLVIIAITYTKFTKRYPSFWSVNCIVIAQLGINAMILVAKPGEFAFLSYYCGLILVLLWAGFIFRLKNSHMIFTSVTNVLFYNITAIFIQKLPSYPKDSIEYASFINNNFMLVSASILSAIGAYQLNEFWKKLDEKNILLQKDKEALIEAKLKAEESEKLKSAFLANMSHEIRTPMNAIIGFCELFKQPNLSKMKEEKYLSVIQNKSAELIQLIDNIIDASRLESNQLVISPTPIEMPEYVEELELNYRETLNLNGKTDVVAFKLLHNFQNKETIFNDKIRINQILNNLVNNAIKFTHKGSINLVFNKENRNGSSLLNIVVRDTGIGIPKAVEDKIFDRFRQGARLDQHLYGGSGLGLSIVKSLVELMKGTIEFTSVVDKGTEFNIVLPLNLTNISDN